MDWWWVAVAVAVVIVAAGVVIWLRSRRTAPAGVSDGEEPAILAEEITPDFPLSGVLVPTENDDPVHLNDLLSTELGTMRESTMLFGSRFAALRRDLVPDPSTQTKLGRNNTVAIALRELTQAIRHGHAPEALFETVQAFTSDMPAEEMVKAVAGVGLRGFTRSGGKISKQAKFVPEVLLRPLASGGSRTLIGVGKGGVVVLGTTIAWPAVAAVAAIVSVSTLTEHQRAEHEKYVRRELRNINQKLDDQRQAQRQTNAQQLATLYSRLIDGDLVTFADVQISLRDVANEFHQSMAELERMHSHLADHSAGTSNDKALAEKLSVDGLDQVPLTLVNIETAIGHQRRAFWAELAVAQLDPSCVQGPELERTLRKQGEQIQQAEALFRGAIESITALNTSPKNWLGLQGKHTKQLADLVGSVRLLFPATDLDEAPENRQVTMIVDEHGDVYVLDNPLDIDDLERKPELERLAGAMRALYDTRVEQTLSA